MTLEDVLIGVRELTPERVDFDLRGGESGISGAGKSSHGVTSSTKPVGNEARERTVEGAKWDGGVVWNSQGVISCLDAEERLTGLGSSG